MPWCNQSAHTPPHLNDRSKLRALRSVRERLKPGSPFPVVDLYLDRASPERKVLQVKFTQMISAICFNVADCCTGRVGATGIIRLPGYREEALLQEAGLVNIERFWAALAWRGWMCRAQGRPSGKP